MAQQNQFEVTFMDEVRNFLKTISPPAAKKITYNIRKIAGGEKNNDLFKKLDGSNELWEFRTLYNGIQYRLLAFWDESEKRLVVATHGFVKKTWKVPSKEIKIAIEQRKKYYMYKNK